MSAEPVRITCFFFNNSTNIDVSDSVCKLLIASAFFASVNYSAKAVSVLSVILSVIHSFCL